MTFLLGTLAAGIVSGLMILAGYAFVGFFDRETVLTRLALAAMAGLAWLVFFASAAGALTPLNGCVAWLAWTPAAVALFMARTRRQFVGDATATLKTPGATGALVGVLSLWFALLLPFLIHPGLAFFDGKTNHDNFFWCIGADYLQHHDYLAVPAKDPDHPLFNLIWSFCGWQPAWARMGTEGYMAIASATFGLTPVRLYNFLASGLMVPWLLLSLAIARRLGLPHLKGRWLALICFCQPVFFFFVANGNIPNLLGALFSGGIWLVVLLAVAARSNPWRLGVVGVLLVHGVLASYPEILLFGLAPAGLLALQQLFDPEAKRGRLPAWLGAVMLAGAALNPLSTVRLWSGIQNSIVQAHNDSNWANIFDRITFAGYIPGLITLGVPTARLYGFIGGLIASAVVLAGFFLVFKNSKYRTTLFFSLSGFFLLLVYTLVTSFGYGWQKSVQFSGIHFAVLFPALAAGALQDYRPSSSRRRSALFVMLAVFGLLLHAMIGITAENLKSSGNKSLTNPALAFHYQVEAQFPNQPVYVDAATFHAAFFQGMWSAKIFPRNPLIFIPRGEQPGGYLWESVKLAGAESPVKGSLYYVAHDWSDAFDYDSRPLLSDPVGALLVQHNLVTAFAGFYRSSGVPQRTRADFSLTIRPYADGWLEFVLAPSGPADGCQLHATVIAGTSNRTVDATMDRAGHLVARFPLQAGMDNILSVKISGAPTMDPESDESGYPLQIVSISSGRMP